MKIHILPEEIIKRIAAGEVVERPASVVKELVENALDAGARRIDLEVKGAGRLVIRITDDGSGMSKEDLLLSIERHSTSKIKSIADIDCITSLGFRGEALYSIAAVSKMEITSRIKEASVAHRLSIQGGQIQNITEVGDPAGTTFEVRDLFWNTPARLKFLKSSTTEMNHIFEIIAQYALSWPDIAFRLKEGDKALLDVAGSQNLLTRIQSLYHGLGEEWIEVDTTLDGLRVYGFVGHPNMSRRDRTHQSFFVNRRPVKFISFNYTIEAAFHSLLPDGRHPISFLFLELNPESVDVNVHPSKREIRLHKPQAVMDVLRESVRKSLSNYYSHAPENSNAQLIEAKENNKNTFTKSPVWDGRVKDSIQSYFASQGHSKPSIHPIRPSMSAQPLPSFDVGVYEALGCFDNLYWAIRLRDGLALMDQHAAHERVLYEKFLKQWREHKIEVQALLIPATFELSKEDHSLFIEYQSVLKGIGFGIEEFGDHSVVVSQVPAYCETHKLKGLIIDILDDLKTLRKTTAFGESKLEERIILRACKSAVKAHDAMKHTEIQRLLEDLLSCELPYTCPHGRPTLIKFNASDLEKMFKRK